jgi:predicted membrane GTPase involved in stress response
LLTKEVRTTVTSIEINETPTLMEVKIPGTEVTKKMNIMDIPGHYHFKERLNEVLDELPRAILVVVDSKEK